MTSRSEKISGITTGEKTTKGQKVNRKNVVISLDGKVPDSPAHH